MTELAAATVEQIILERFGSKSMRIFRFIREKKYVEENQIQQVLLLIFLTKIIILLKCFCIKYVYLFTLKSISLYKSNKMSESL